MKKKLKFYLFWIVVFSLFFKESPIFAQFNHPELKWEEIKSPHFFVYYYRGEESFAQKIVNFAEQVYPRITTDLGYRPTSKTPIIIKNYDDTSGGYTSLLEGKIVIQAQSDPFSSSGDLYWAREVIAHEFTHIVTFAAVGGESVIPLRRLIANLILPMWFIEGLAEYEGEEWHSLKEMVVNDEASEGKIFKKVDLGAFYFFDGWGRLSGYYQSESFVRYIFNTYGKDKIAPILAYLRNQPLLKLTGELNLGTGEMDILPAPSFPSFDEALKKIIGKDSSTLYTEWRRWIINKCPKEKSPEFPLLPQKLLSSQGIKNRSPIFSPSGEKIAFTSNRGYDYSIFDLYLMDLQSKKVKKLEEAVNPDIFFSPDGKKILYSKMGFCPDKRAFLNDIYLIDIERGKKTRLTSGLRATQPSFSPDGEKIVFVKKEGGNSNLCLLNLKDGKVFSLTNSYDGLTQNFSPSFSPDGRSIVFVSFRKGKRDIYLMNLKEGIFTPLTLDKADDRCPLFSSCGNYIYFVSNRKNGIFNLYSLCLKDKSIERFVPLEQIFEPNISPDGKEIVFSKYSKGKFNIYLAYLKDFKKERIVLYEERKTKMSSLFRIYPSSSYQPEIDIHYFFPWVYLINGYPYLSLESYASDVLEKHTLIFTAFIGEDSQYDLTYINRNFLPTLWLNIYKSQEKRGLDTGLEYLLDAQKSVEVALRFERRNIYPYLSLEPQSVEINSIRTAWMFNKMIPVCDPEFNPRGSKAFLGVEYSGKEIGSDLGYVFYQGEWKNYKDLGNKRSLAFQISGGRIENKEGSIPLSLTLGGENIFRGYPLNYLSGENILFSSLEYRFLLLKRIGGSSSFYLDRLGGVLFVDVGSAWGKEKQMELKRSLGFEARLRILPFSRYSLIFRLGVAWPLDYEDKRGKVFFTIGNVF